MTSVTSQNGEAGCLKSARAVERCRPPFTFAMDRLRRLLGFLGGGLRQETSTQRHHPATTETTVVKNSGDALVPLIFRHLGVSSYIHI
jgi:hypothetical protein